MGCDIHLTVERRVKGKWRRVDKLPPRACSWCDGTGKYPDGRECYSCRGTKQTVEPYHDRNYTVFSVLADVRNDGYVTPIAEPRELPEDAVLFENEEDGWHGDHSFSHLSLRELLDYDWKQTIKDEGFVDLETFKAWDTAGGKGPPARWCGGVGGPSVKHVSNSEMRRRIAEPYEWEKLDHPYTLLQWTVSLDSYCKSFLAFMETLKGLADSPDDVRIVFGFDS